MNFANLIHFGSKIVKVVFAFSTHNNLSLTPIRCQKHQRREQ